jgi:hypothetical protein
MFVRKLSRDQNGRMLATVLFKIIFLTLSHIQTGSGARTVSYTMGTSGCLPGGKVEGT